MGEVERDRSRDAAALDPARSGAVWDALTAAVPPHGLRVAASSEMRRVEAGILNAGTDLTPELTPYDAGLGRLVDLDKPEPCLAAAALRAAAAAPQSARSAGSCSTLPVNS